MRMKAVKLQKTFTLAAAVAAAIAALANDRFTVAYAGPQ